MAVLTKKTSSLRFTSERFAEKYQGTLRVSSNAGELVFLNPPLKLPLKSSASHTTPPLHPVKSHETSKHRKQCGKNNFDMKCLFPTSVWLTSCQRKLNKNYATLFVKCPKTATKYLPRYAHGSHPHSGGRHQHVAAAVHVFVELR